MSVNGHETYIILYYALLGSVVVYESKQTELVRANSSTVQVPYVEVHENASNYLNGLCTADLGPLDKLLSIYKSHPCRHTGIYIYIPNSILISGRTIRYV